MNENIVSYTFSLGDPTEGNTVSTNALYFMVPFGATLIYVSVAPWDDGTGTLDINDDGTGIVAAVDATDKDVPGEWISTHCGGTETPIAIAAGSICDFDINTGDAANRYDICMLMLQGSAWG